MRVGIPRGLLYYQYFPMWKVFFEHLGAEVVISPPTTKEISSFGCSRVAGDVCFPVKVFCGHVQRLVGECDYVFIPSIHSMQQNVYNCPKFIGLPDLVRATVPESPPVLDPDIDVNKGKRDLYQAIYKLGRTFTSSPLKVKRAADEALSSHRTYLELMQHQGMTPPQAIGRMFPQFEEATGEDGFASTITIAIIGHPYLIYDRYVNHGLVDRLRKMGVKVAFAATVTEDELQASMAELGEQGYWGYEDEIIGAGGHYLRNGVDGVISIVAFGCGPDSLMAALLQHHAKRLGKPFLNLVIDEHSAEAGLVTRIEAFTDMARRQNKTPYRQIYLGQSHVEEQDEIHAVGIPNMANIAPAFRAAAEVAGISMIVPPVTKRTISLGTRYSPEFVCLPFKAILGTFIESLEMGADTLFMITSSNACRMGYYSRVQEQILRDLGYKFRFFRHKSADKGILAILRTIKRYTNDTPWATVIAAYRLATTKLKVLDDLERRLNKDRAIEIEKGRSDRIVREAIQAIGETKDLSSLKRVVRQCSKKLDQVPKDLEAVPLKVGVIGEIYVIMEPLVNMNLEVELGKLGAEVRRTKTTYFSEYTNLSSYLNVLNNEKKKLRKFAWPYLRRDVGGHGLESVGEKVRLARQGYDGVVHVAPFTCMPEAIAQNVMLTTKEDIPVLTIVCDEQLGQAGMLTRIEAFVDLLEWRRKRRPQL